MREHGLSHAVAGNLGALVPTTDRHNPATYTRQAPRMLTAAAALISAPRPSLNTTLMLEDTNCRSPARPPPRKHS